jgi:hypothetical protein
LPWFALRHALDAATLRRASGSQANGAAHVGHVTSSKIRLFERPWGRARRKSRRTPGRHLSHCV